MRIHSLLHESFEDTGYIRAWAEKNGHPFSETCVFCGEQLPDSEAYDLLVVMGGSMNIYEEEKYPWLAVEKRFLKSAIDSGKKVIGICLGAQLIASVLGAEVKRNPAPELGWFEVEMTDEGREAHFFSLHWHVDTFALPNGSVHLFKSAGCKNQGFLYGKAVLGLQFHPEVTAGILRNLVEHCSDDITGDPEYVQGAAEILDESYIPHVNGIMSVILDYFGGMGE